MNRFLMLGVTLAFLEELIISFDRGVNVPQAETVQIVDLQIAHEFELAQNSRWLFQLLLRYRN